MIIRLKKEFDILNKKVKLHENTIKKIHNSNTYDGLLMGKTLCGLRRRKKNFKLQNEIINDRSIFKLARKLDLIHKAISNK